MFILHVALQGCLRARDVEYGLTADTGGHIRYLLDLVEASAADPAVSRIVVATRRFEDARLGGDYAQGAERIDGKTEIVRFWTDHPGYLEKEALHTEVESFADGLVAFIEAQDQRPAVIHAHYADAASVAAIVEARLGIPFVFTAHSLGLVKREAMGLPAGADAALDRRIEAENAALERAALVIASSRDEAEVQWAGYRSYEPGRIRILAPGSDLTRFAGAPTCVRVDASIARFLREPEKPVILALARPVAKKNLAALVRAYGESPALQAAANLVIFAGTREDYAALDGDMAVTVAEILALIDRYDLYGRVAYPKQHRPEDVPAIYAHARERGGIFVNPALNEPFGLTLLEASAAGLPLVATDSGGPNDIVEMCGNGILVNPRSDAAIAEGALKILSDADLRARFAAAGASVAGAYDWTRHSERYHALLASLAVEGAGAAHPEQLLICDIDNTLVGCAEGIRTFGTWRERQPGLAFGVATGRSFHSALAILEQQDAPRPQVVISSVGSEIHHLDRNGTTYSQDPEWRAIVSRDWSRDDARRVLAKVPGLLPQAPLEQRAHKLSYFTEGQPGIVGQVRAALERAGLRCSVIHSHGRYLDVLPIRASKGTAVDFVRARLGLTPDAVFVAGDSGNDIEMLRTIPQAIIVGNFSDGLAAMPALRHSYVAHNTHARGVIEGVLHFRDKARAAACKPAR
ncbi:HAD-IIB family hydrolase [Aureimonas sp. AU22]|uniref:HAD-IIB family hydrolase n=1 Tax=Aureimonas sp. AU22 TaxID=1638162 RepID=UPI00078124C6|nr:HAD-IIB family hydrolase [Aureimonas sp. AU22]